MGEKKEALLWGPRVGTAIGQGVAGKVLEIMRREQRPKRNEADLATQHLGRFAAGGSRLTAELSDNTSHIGDME